MNKPHQLPVKERKLRAEYSFNQTEKQDKMALKREMEQLKKEKSYAYREITDKEQQENEAVKRLLSLIDRGEESC